MEWVASTLHTTLEHGVSSITTADAHTSAASSRLNWRPCRFKWTRPFRRKTKFVFCVCAITFQTHTRCAYRKKIQSMFKGLTLHATISAWKGQCVCKLLKVWKWREQRVKLLFSSSEESFIFSLLITNFLFRMSETFTAQLNTFLCYRPFSFLM